LAHPRAFRSFLDHVGGPSERHFREQGLPVYCSDPDALVPLVRVWSLIEATARREGLLVGWLVGRFVGDHNLNEALARKLANAPTLYLALSRFTRLVRSEASHIQLDILHRRDDILVCTHYADLRAASGYHLAQTYQLAVILELLRHFLGRNWVPAEIGVESATVPIGLRDLFPGCRILSGRRVGYIAVPRSCLHIGASARAQGRASDPLVMTDGFDYVDTLVALLKAYLADGYPSARDAASLIGTSERTLARALSSRGLTYGAVIDEVRFNVAAELLRETDARITEISLSVGFDDPAHFARMFRRIAGLSPREYRGATARDRLPEHPRPESQTR
jgi:AraC-like DNA-binding protein